MVRQTSTSAIRKQTRQGKIQRQIQQKRFQEAKRKAEQIRKAENLEAPQGTEGQSLTERAFEQIQRAAQGKRTLVTKEIAGEYERLLRENPNLQEAVQAGTQALSGALASGFGTNVQEFLGVSGALQRPSISIDSNQSQEDPGETIRLPQFDTQGNPTGRFREVPKSSIPSGSGIQSDIGQGGVKSSFSDIGTGLKSALTGESSFSIEQEKAAEDIERKLEKNVPSEIEDLNFLVENFNQKYSDRELNPQEFEIAQREAQFLESKQASIENLLGIERRDLTPSMVTSAPTFLEQYIRDIKSNIPELRKIKNEDLRKTLQNSALGLLIGGTKASIDTIESKISRGLGSLRGSDGLLLFSPEQAKKTSILVTDIGVGYGLGSVAGTATSLLRGSLLSLLPKGLSSSKNFLRVISLLETAGALGLTAKEVKEISKIYVEQGEDEALSRLIKDVSFGFGFSKTGLKSNEESIKFAKDFGNKIKKNLVSLRDKRGGADPFQVLRKKKKIRDPFTGKIIEVTEEELKTLFVKNLEKRLIKSKSLEEQKKLLAEIRKGLTNKESINNFNDLVLKLIERDVLKIPKREISPGIFVKDFRNVLSNKVLENPRYSNLPEKLTQNRIRSLNRRAAKLEETQKIRNQKLQITKNRLALKEDERELRRLIYRSKLKGVDKEQIQNQIRFLSQKVKQQQLILQKSKQNYQQTLKQRQIERQIQRENQKEIQRQRIISRQQQKEFQKTKQKTRLISGSSFGFRASPSIFSKTGLRKRPLKKPRRRIGIITGLPKIPSSKKKKLKFSPKPKTKRNVDVIVRSEGKFSKVNKRPLTKKSANKKLRNDLQGSLSASGYLQNKKGKKLRVKPGGDFRLGKKDKFLLVEKRNKRLNTRTEVNLIKDAKRKKIKPKKSKIKATKQIKFKKKK